MCSINVFIYVCMNDHKALSQPQGPSPSFSTSWAGTTIINPSRKITATAHFFFTPTHLSHGHISFIVSTDADTTATMDVGPPSDHTHNTLASSGGTFLSTVVLVSVSDRN